MSNLELSQARRLDQYIVEQIPVISRAFAAKLISQGKVSVNGSPILKAGYKLRSTDAVTIDYDFSHETAIPAIKLPIIYEDDDCVVINKPLGLLTHSKGAFNPEATVASWLRSRISAPEGERAGIVHRLDRATSGVMICAKNPAAMSWLQKQFSTRKVKKTYIAIVQGLPANPEAIIDLPIERNPRKPQTFRVGSSGKASVTAYTVIETKGHLSLLELRPTTGRTHQLRVHLNYIGHTIIGDTFYDGAPAPRLFLHAASLEITLPSRERKVFSAPLPPEFKQYLKEAA
jgi:23S rRNA pseudouridine1911/1915/1917 synthase